MRLYWNRARKCKAASREGPTRKSTLTDADYLKRTTATAHVLDGRSPGLPPSIHLAAAYPPALAFALAAA